MEISKLVLQQRQYFNSNKTKPVQTRIQLLQKLQAAIKQNQEQILQALWQDLGKDELEGYMAEVGMVLDEIKFALAHIKSWAKPKRVKTPFMHFLSQSKIYYEPYGVVLIMSPWNYPFMLSIAPVVGAVCAGNCFVLKPSAYSPATSAVIQKIIADCFDTQYGTVVLGGRQENCDLLCQKFDYIFFTGSAEVGKTVMRAAAENLTPISLELGGKSPCIVDKTANIELSAKRIIWGKLLNAGQTCVAPDYIYVHSSVKQQLIEQLKICIKNSYDSDALNCEQYPKIINQKHFERINALIKGEQIAFGGNSDAKSNKIEPTILDNVTWASPVMCEEIFGPVIPVLTFDDIGIVIDTVKSKSKPLALYLFTTDKAVKQKVLSEVSFGGGCVNDTIVHLATSHMPFGGVGDSGMGGYHGKFSFETFSHKKSILQKSNMLDINLRYPPYSKKNLSVIKGILK